MVVLILVSLAWALTISLYVYTPVELVLSGAD